MSANEVNLKQWSRQYFEVEYLPPGLAFMKIEFGPKQGGEQLGRQATIKYMNQVNIPVLTKYHIKTHERGVSQNKETSNLFDPREMLVYRFLQFSGLGPEEAHFYYNPIFRGDLYIATKDIGGSFKTFDFLANKLSIESLIHKFSQEPNYMRCLIFIEIISKIFCLSDINNNFGNFGFVSPVDSFKCIRLIDFFICDILVDSDMIKRFEEPNISLKNKEDNDKTNVFFTVTKDNKIAAAVYIFGDIMETEQNFFKQNFTKARENTNQFVEDYEKGMKSQPRKEFEEIKSKYEKYSKKVQENFERFIKKYHLDLI